MTVTDEIIKHLQERKNYNKDNPCLAREDHFCIEVVKTIVKSYEESIELKGVK